MKKQTKQLTDFNNASILHFYRNGSQDGAAFNYAISLVQQETGISIRKADANTDAGQKEASSWQIAYVPHAVIIKDGQEVNRVSTVADLLTVFGMRRYAK
jgi:thioredoxin-like negative regulator of GroEL